MVGWVVYRVAYFGSRGVKRFFPSKDFPAKDMRSSRRERFDTTGNRQQIPANLQ